jgi:hypothetical protein
MPLTFSSPASRAEACSLRLLCASLHERLCQHRCSAYVWWAHTSRGRCWGGGIHWQYQVPFPVATTRFGVVTAYNPKAATAYEQLSVDAGLMRMPLTSYGRWITRPMGAIMSLTGKASSVGFSFLRIIVGLSCRVVMESLMSKAVLTPSRKGSLHGTYIPIEFMLTPIFVACSLMATVRQLRDSTLRLNCRPMPLV